MGTENELSLFPGVVIDPALVLTQPIWAQLSAQLLKSRAAAQTLLTTELEESPQTGLRDSVTGAI